MNVRQSLTVKLILSFLISIICLSGCNLEKQVDHSQYISEIEQWRTDRLERLRGPRSWLSLIGRYPLQPGANSIGTYDTNDIRFSGETMMNIAVVYVDSLGVKMQPAESGFRRNTDPNSGVSIFLDDGTLFTGGAIDMSAPPYFHYSAYYWTFLERAGQYYFRLWDTLSPARSALHEIPVYPIDPEWNIDVTFTAADSGTMIVLDDIQGEKRPNPVEGYVSGTWRDTSFTLMALDGGEEELFMIIEDATTDIETYPGGRYLNIPRADSTGRTKIDFNKAYIPPCAFTEFATCLLPPEENRLPFAVRAGEKDYRHE